MNYLYLVFFISSFFNADLSSTDEAKKKITFTFEGRSCEKVDSMFLYTFNGMGFDKYMSTPQSEAGQFHFELKKGDKKFYYVGPNPQKFKSVILGEEEKVLMNGSCPNAPQAGVAEGINADYNRMMKKIREYRNQQIQLSRAFATVMGKEEEMNEVRLKMKAIDEKKTALLAEAKKIDPWLGKIISLYTYLSYHNNGKAYKNELEYFVNQYGIQADLSDKAYNNVPMVFDSYRNFSQMLAKTKVLPEAELEKALKSRLSKAPKGSETYRYVLGGMVSGLKAANSGLFIPFAETYIEEYKESAVAESLKAQIKNAKSFIIGAEAPNFAMNDVEGNEVNLTDFRGKVLLVDFWASWCGPCRKENPHVKKLYNKYADQGFEVLGVSLDKTKSRWVQAIEKDGLSWQHVSDLKGWGNEAAKMYSVRSIPHTVLLDEEGRIIARNLRGSDLDQRLKKIFGK